MVPLFNYGWVENLAASRNDAVIPSDETIIKAGKTHNFYLRSHPSFFLAVEDGLATPFFHRRTGPLVYRKPFES